MGSAGDGLYLQVLVVRCQLGDRGAFAEILSVCQPRLRAYLHRMLPGSQDVDDVAQEVWADVFRDLASLAKPGSFLPWLYRIAHNRAARLMRAPRPPTASWDDLTEIGEADESLEFTAEDAQAVHDARGLAWIGQRLGRRSGQPNAPIDLAQQQQSAITAEVPAAEVCFDQPAAKAAELYPALRTLWHRQSSVVIGVEYL